MSIKIDRILIFAIKSMENLSKLLPNLKDHLSKVPDPREPYKIKYYLTEILFLVVSGVTSDCREWQELVDFGEDKLDWLRQYYPYASGIPSHDTLNRVFSLLDKKAFGDMFVDWVTAGLTLEAGSQIAVDGKYSRSSATKLEQQTPRDEGGKKALHLVSAWCNDVALCLSSREVSAKSNELSAIPLILNDLEVSGCVMSMDAIFCQKEVARQIVEREADYLIGLKLNQETLLTAVETAFGSVENEDSIQTFSTEIEVDHGRIEQRKCRAMKATLLPDWANVNQWAKLAMVVEVQSSRIIMANSNQTMERRYYITSLDVDAQKLQHYIRGHWGIENKLHWTLDVHFGEDSNRKRVGNAAANFSLVLRFALNLLKKHPEKASISRKMKKCSRDDLYRQAVLSI